MTIYKTKNGRIVKDGGGILPDIVINKDKYGMIISSLVKERLFFNYATDYRLLNDSIPLNFIFKESDFIDFTKYLKDKDYSYKTETEQALEDLKKQAEKEKYFSSLSVEYDSLFNKMINNKSDDLLNSKEDIKQILTGEIMSRYFYQKGRILAGLSFDEEVVEAIQILKDTERYQQILSAKE
jgi:carboxyl-terminal processing protease